MVAQCVTRVQALLIANAALVALVPASRIKTVGQWQNLELPYIVHFPVGLAPFRTHSGLPSMTIWDVYQVSAYATTYSSGRAIAEAVKTALDGVHGSTHLFWKAFRHITEDETRVEHFVVEFQVSE